MSIDVQDAAQGVQSQADAVAGKPSESTPKPPKAAKVLKTQTKGKVVSRPAKPKVGKGKGPKATKSGKKPAAKTPKAPKTVKTAKPTGDIPNSCPFRPTSSYGRLWVILHAHREQGITRPDLIAAGVKAVGKTAKSIGYDVAVVLSPKEDGSAHRSANRAADKYWVERVGDNYIMRLR